MKRTSDISYGLAQIAKSLDDMGRKPWGDLVAEAGYRVEEMRILLGRFQDLDADQHATEADWSRFRQDVAIARGDRDGEISHEE